MEMWSRCEYPPNVDRLWCSHKAQPQPTLCAEDNITNSVKSDGGLGASGPIVFLTVAIIAQLSGRVLVSEIVFYLVVITRSKL